MTQNPARPRQVSAARTVPRYVGVLSATALAIPVIAAFARPDLASRESAFMLWLPALIPPFLLAYRRGWPGAALAFAAEMATLAFVQVGFFVLGLPSPPWTLLFPLAVLMAVVAAGSGWTADLLHRERKRAERTARTPRFTEGNASELAGVHVLVVDDDDDSLRATTRVLLRLGCTVSAAASPREALAIAARGGPLDLLITDIVMPDMSGFTLVEVASRVRPELPVLYVSGYPREEVYWGATPGARSAFLGKPLEMGELRTSLLALLDPSRQPGAPAPSVDRPGRRPALRVETAEARPLRTTLTPASTPAALEARVAAQGEGRILIVDDDESIVSTLQKLFTRAGYERPIGLTDPRQVVSTLQNHPVDLVVLDLYMPEVDGFQVLEAVTRFIGPEEYLPVLILSGDDDPLVRRRALAGGAMDFLSKPFDPAEAEARVRNLLATRFLNQRVALQRDTLEERVIERTSELADTRSEILHRLARAAEYRDDVTGRHAERVGLLSSRVASELGLPPHEVDIIRRTAPLHDIGKIGVPDAILYKPGPLTPMEFDIMKTHTTIGAQILGGSTHRLLDVARSIALCHHERWDGLGYPQGRAGTEIPLEARIVAVVDSFDTITHARTYKGALSPADAFEEIVRCRGKHYDPGVVEAFESIKARVGGDHLLDLGDPLDPSRDTMGSHVAVS